MELTPYVEMLRRDLAAAADAASTEVREAADRLSYAVEPSVRLALFEALGAAAGDITRQLERAVVEVRLRGRDAELVVTEHAPPAPPAPPGPPAPPVPPGPPTPPAPDSEEGVARISLRLPDSVKVRVEQAAAAAGLSANAWLVRAAVQALDAPPREERLFPTIGQRLTGWQR